MEWILNLDKNIILELHNILPNYPILISIFKLITFLGNNGFIWIVTSIFLIIKKSTRNYGIIMIISLVLGILIGNVFLKNIFERSRPFIALNFSPFIAPPSGFSMPSGHSLSSFIGAVVIYRFNKKWGILAFIIASLIAASRVVLLVHFPSDVILGALLGIIIGNFTFIFFKHRLKNNTV